ncbi:MAG: preprotein translocase subunit SecG [Gemmatimonadota bacterium]|nr:MAG: preprotein translocase subunit SecG [Gemmatimonadota bacterium]
MFVVMIILHILISVFLVLVVLLQASKGAGLAGAFGGGLGGGMGAVFGGRGAAPFLSKATTVLAIAFMLSCIVQLKMSPAVGRAPQSVIQREAEEKARRQPAEALPMVSEEMPVVTPPVEEVETETQPAAATDTTQQ